MQFLNPTAIAVAAGLTIPPVVALYFLKLRRTARKVSSTLLWRQSVEDLRVNAPFQRLRRNLLLFLQLIALLLAALALGDPMFQTAQRLEDTAIILIDRSASMGVMEVDGRTRLEWAKEEARKQIDGLRDGAQAMVIEFCDRANIVASFSTDKPGLKQKVDGIEPSQSTTSLSEAMNLAGAYARIEMIGDQPGSSAIPPGATAPPASVFVYSDARIEDADRVSPQTFEHAAVRFTRIGSRGDNVGIVNMDARRNYERPEELQVTATIENFGPDPQSVDAVLYLDGRNLDVQTVVLGGTTGTQGGDTTSDHRGSPGPAQHPASSAVAAFDPVLHGGGGVVEVVLQVQDGLPLDDRAWTILEEARPTRILLVAAGNWILESALSTPPFRLEVMSPDAYEKAAEEQLTMNGRSVFDVVVLDRHGTSRLPNGNYFFWGAAPILDGVDVEGVVHNETIFGWDETHPVLRHVSLETLSAFEWIRLRLPLDAVSIADTETASAFSFLTRGGRRFLISAFSVMGQTDEGASWLNSKWVAQVDFLLFVHNSVNFLASNVATSGRRTVRPGDPVTLSMGPRIPEIRVHRPDGEVDVIVGTGSDSVIYPRTQLVGPYVLEPVDGVSGPFAVNLFSRSESDILPARQIPFAGQISQTRTGTEEVNRSAAPHFLFGLLGVLLLEWLVYSRRILV